MNQKNLVIGAIISVVFLIIVTIVLIIVGPKIKTTKKETIQIVKQNTVSENTQSEPLVAIIEQEEERKDASMITQDLQSINQNIGKLSIPKTGLNTEIYCKQDANKMEEVPCMLYTNEGPNQPGMTILVGHNRANGTLFSNNNLLEENDVFYFTDYITNEEKKYTVISKFVTESTDVSFYNNPSDKPIIAMQCCLTPTDGVNVLIVMARAE